MLQQVTDMIVGIDSQGKVHIQAFFQEGVTETRWVMGWCVVGQRPSWKLGIFFTDPKNPVAAIEDPAMIRSIITSVMNESGYICDTYIGKPQVEPQGQTQISYAKPGVTQWVALDNAQRVFFQTLLQWLP